MPGRFRNHCAVFRADSNRMRNLILKHGEVCCWKRGFKNLSRVGPFHQHIECGTLVRDLRCCYICFSNKSKFNTIMTRSTIHTPVIANMSWDSKCCQDWTGAFQQRNWKVAQVANLSSGTRKTAMMVKVPSWFRLLVGVAHVYAFLLLPPSCHHKDCHAKALFFVHTRLTKHPLGSY